jgi:hypothetical protein
MLTNQMRAALIAARAMIASGEENYICLALTDIGCARPDLDNACEALREYIRIALGEYSTLYSWQVNTGVLPGHAPHNATRVRQLRRDRLAWIDWMLMEE